MSGGLMQGSLGELSKAGSSKAFYEDKVKDGLLGLSAKPVLDLLQGDLNSNEEQTLNDQLNEYTKSKGIAVVILDALDDPVVASVNGTSYFVDGNTNKLKFTTRAGAVAPLNVSSQIKAAWTTKPPQKGVSTDTFWMRGQTMSTAKTSIYTESGYMNGAVATVGLWGSRVEAYGGPESGRPVNSSS